MMRVLLVKELLLLKIQMLQHMSNAPFISSISKLNNTLIDNAEDLDTVMQMYNLIEYSKNYSKTSGRLWNYYRDSIAL